MEYKYFDGWHRYNREPIKALTAEEAKSRHRKGKACCVVITDEQRDRAFIDVTSDYFSVNFLDKQRHVYLTYGFEDVGEGKLFLNQAFFFEFSNEESQPSEATSYFFNKAGVVTIERSRPPFNSAEVTEVEHDGTGNWTTRPEFGDYQELLSEERNRYPAGWRNPPHPGYRGRK